MAQLMTIDDRAPLQRYRRTQLLWLCEDLNIPLAEEFPKDKLLTLLMGAGVDENHPPIPKMPRPEREEPKPEKLSLKS